MISGDFPKILWQEASGNSRASTNPGLLSPPVFGLATMVAAGWRGLVGVDFGDFGDFSPSAGHA